MNFITENLISELKELIELKVLLEKGSIEKEGNAEKILQYVKDQIEQNMKDIVHTEKL